MIWWLLIGYLGFIATVSILALITMEDIVNKLKEENIKLKGQIAAYRIERLYREEKYNIVNVGLYREERFYKAKIGEISLKGEKVDEEVRRNVGVYKILY